MAVKDQNPPIKGNLQNGQTAMHQRVRYSKVPLYFLEVWHNDRFTIEWEHGTQ